MTEEERKAEDTENIKGRLEDTKEFLAELNSYLDENFKIIGNSGKGYSIDVWRKQFIVNIPPADEITFPTLVALSAEIFKKYQQAAYYRDKQGVQMTVLEQAKFEKYHTAYQSARNRTEKEFGKPLAAESCKVEATLATKHLEDAIANQKVIKDFWNKTCETLTELRKLIEIMGYALSGDAKVGRDFVVRAKSEE
jgi:hypothetical protein